MTPYLQPLEQIRISKSPGRSPQLTPGLKSPVKSVHLLLQKMDSIYAQTDIGMKTIDFFDDTSEEGSVKGVNALEPSADITSVGRHNSNKKHRGGIPDESLVSECEGVGGSPTLPSHEGYERLTPSLLPESMRRTAHTSSSSLVGSVDELLPVRSSSPPFKRLSQAEKASNIEHSVDTASRSDPVIEAYAIAHDITLRALMRDENTLDKRFSSLPMARLRSNDRHSVSPKSSHNGNGLQASRNRALSSPPSNGRRVQIIPTPIDTTSEQSKEATERASIPVSPEPVHRKKFDRGVTISSQSIRPTTIESMLTLSIRQTNKNSWRRVTTMVIPASNDFSLIRANSPRAKEQHFKTLDFDDVVFFQRLRQAYTRLMGPWRIFSARSLQRIVVSGPSMKGVDREYWIYQPRSSRSVAYNGLKDTFSEERIMQYYRNPGMGRSRYAFVHWAHRLTAAPSPRAARSDDLVLSSEDNTLTRRDEQHEGVEFVVSWSMTRIALALGLVLSISIAAALLWIFLGRSTAASSPANGGFRDAGDRVTAGIVIGICLFLFGCGGTAGWLGVSWLVM